MTRPVPPLTWKKLPASALQADAGLRADWDRLNEQRSGLTILSADAFAAGLAVFGTGAERLLVAQQGARAVAMLLLVPDGALRWRSFQPSQLPLGGWVAEAGLDLPALCRSAMRGPLGLCLGLSITQVDPLLAERPDDASDFRCSDYIPTAWVEIEGSFDDYWAARGKNLRQNLRKQRNKLATEGVTTSLRVLRAPEEMAPAIARYGALESAGWKADQGTAIHPDNDQGRFYTRWFEAAARRGEAFVTEYLFGDKTAALNLGLLRQGTLIVLKTTYDESIPKSLSPAFLLREDELKLFFGGQEVRRVEYYGRVMDWHTKLTDRQRTLYHLSAYRWPIVKQWAQRRRQAEPAAGEAVAIDAAQPEH